MSRRKTIDASAVRKIAAETDCDPKTVRKVFQSGEARYASSRRIKAALIKSGHLPDEG